MPKPKFTSVDGSVSVTMDNGEFFPIKQSFVANQRIAYAQGGQAKVAEFSSDDRRIYVANMKNETETKLNSLLAFFQHAKINYMEKSFFYYPDSDDAAKYSVRLTSPKIDWEEARHGGYDIQVRMRQEV